MKPFALAGCTALLLGLFMLALPELAPGQMPARQATRVGFVSAQRILTDSATGKAETARMQAAQQQRTAALRTKQQALESTRASLATSSDPSAIAKLQQQEQQQRLELERATQQAQSDLQVLQRQLQTDLQAKVRPIVEAVAKAEGVDLVLSYDTTVVWAAAGLDLTDAVLGRLDNQ